MTKTMIQEERELDKLLKQRRNFSFKYLKEHFDYKNDLEFLNFLIMYLNKKIASYNFESDVASKKYITKLSKYFGYSQGKISLNNEDDSNNINYLNNLEELRKNIKLSVIENVDKTSSKNAIENSILLLTFEKRLEEIIKDTEEKLLLPSKIDIIENNNLLDLIKDITFNTKSAQILESLLETFPNIAIIKDIDDKLLFEKILDKYFNILLNKNDYYEKMYYEKVIELFRKYSYLTEGSISLDKTLYYNIQKYLNQLPNKKITKEKEEYIIASLNERIRVSTPIEEREKVEVEDIKDDLENAYLKERLDLTNRHIITLDNNEAKILENAISIEEREDNLCLLTIYAVDIAHFISRNKSHEKKTYNNILEQGTILFNKKYRYENFNLKEEKKVPVIAYQFLIDENMNITSFDFKRAVVYAKENLKFKDFNNYDELSEETKKTFAMLIKIVGSELDDIDKIDETVADRILYIINDLAAKTIADYTDYKKLPLIYRREIDNIKVIENLETKNDVNLSFLKYNKKLNYPNTYTIGNDGIYKENDFNISIFSPARRLDSLINQLLVNIYLVDHKKLDSKTLEYLKSELDSIAEKVTKTKQKDKTVNIEKNLTEVKQLIK